jgi:hypothetical protein
MISRKNNVFSLLISFVTSRLGMDVLRRQGAGIGKEKSVLDGRSSDGVNYIAGSW